QNNHLAEGRPAHSINRSQSESAGISWAGTQLSIRVSLIKRQSNQADTANGALSVGRRGYDCPMKRLQLAHMPLRTKLIAASALTASMALLIVAITQCISSYYFEHNEA